MMTKPDMLKLQVRAYIELLPLHFMANRLHHNMWLTILILIVVIIVLKI